MEFAEGQSSEALGQTAMISPMKVHLLGTSNSADEAGSLGAFGSRFQFAWRQIHHEDRQELQSDDNISGSVKQISMSKGLPFPLDLGLVFSTLPDHVTYGEMSGKWTFWEGFQRPSLSIKLSVSRLWGFSFIESSSIDMDLMASYRLNRYLHFFFNYKNSVQHYQLQDMVRTAPLHSTVSGMGMGMRLVILPPHLALSIEREKYAAEYESFLFGLMVAS